MHSAWSTAERHSSLQSQVDPSLLNPLVFMMIGFAPSRSPSACCPRATTLRRPVACGRRNVPATLAVARFQCAATGHGAVDCTPAGVAVAASGISIGRRSVAILLAAGAVGLSRKLPAAVAGERLSSACRPKS